MNTLNKRSMKLGLCALFIGAAMMPAYAQRGFKPMKPRVPKPPRAGGTANSAVRIPKTPVVLPTASHASVAATAGAVVRVPVTPHVPPTLKGAAQIPNFTAAVNKALDNAVEHAVVSQTIAVNTQNESLNAILRSKIGKWNWGSYGGSKAFVKIANIDIFRLLEKEKGKGMEDISRFIELIDTGDLKKGTDFTKLVTSDTPEFIPIEGEINSYKDMQKSWALSHIEYPRHGNVSDRGDVLRRGIEVIDSYFFVEHNGQFYVNKHSLTQVHSYEEALAKLALKVNVTFLNFHHLVDMIYLVNLRNQQIMDALKAANNAATPQFKGIPQTDVTTQRTAEEIQSLVENLDPENPLRQAIEGTLKDNGYIAPAE